MIDLHSHTYYSDGTFSPAELLAEASNAGLSALAITDHDTLQGYEVAVAGDIPPDLEVICGVELSTKFHGVTVHLLAYFPVQPPSIEFRTWLTDLLETRRDRNRRLVERLQSLGIDITLAEVEAKGRSLTGRPHFARVMMEKGYVKDLQQAFDEYLDESAKAYVFREEVPIDIAIQKVLAAGGVPSLAHPVRVAKNNWATLAEWIGELAGFGLRAVEVYHSDHTPENVGYYKQLATRYGLGITGGSDFHGANKPKIALGKGMNGNVQVPDEILAGLKALAK